LLKAYKDLITKLVVGLSPKNSTIPKEKIDSMIDLEISLAKVKYLDYFFSNQTSRIIKNK
jgi:hypothetical protein